MTTTALNVDDLRSHIGRRLTSSDVLHPGPANLLRLAFARPEPELKPGDPLPPAWLALYFLPRFGPDELRPDGSPRDAGVVPAMPLPRRMFAGESVHFHRPLRLGEVVRRETELADISVKSGGTGTLVFATVTNRVFGPDGLALEEERRTVFREEVKTGDRNQAPRRDAPPADTPWRRKIAPDPVLLFRFSALTFNSHRISLRPHVGDGDGRLPGPRRPRAAHHRAPARFRARLPSAGADDSLLHDPGAGTALRYGAVRAPGQAARRRTWR